MSAEHETPSERRTAPDDPPGAVSNQNHEEAESEHREDGTHPEPRSRDRAPADAPHADR